MSKAMKKEGGKGCERKIAYRREKAYKREIAPKRSSRHGAGIESTTYGNIIGH
jgi:hypothetical protein